MAEKDFGISIPGLLYYELGSMKCNLILGVNPKTIVEFRITDIDKARDSDIVGASFSPTLIRKLFTGLLMEHVIVNEAPISLQIADRSMLFGREIEFVLGLDDPNDLAIYLPIKRSKTDKPWRIEVKRVYLRAAVSALDMIIKSWSPVRPGTTD